MVVVVVGVGESNVYSEYSSSSCTQGGVRVSPLFRFGIFSQREAARADIYRHQDLLGSLFVNMFGHVFSTRKNL